MKVQQSRDWELVNLGDVTCHKNSITLEAEKKLVQSMFANRDGWSCGLLSFLSGESVRSSSFLFQVPYLSKFKEVLNC